MLARKYHTLLGILVAVHLMILSLSGVMLLFKSEVQHAPQRTSTNIDQREFAEKYEQAYQRLLSHYPDDKPLDIYPDEHNAHLIQARLGIHGVNKVRGARIVNIDYQSGREVLATELPHTKLYNWLLTLHHQLFLGPNGQIYIGMMGIAFIFMNVTGLLLFFKKRRHQPFETLASRTPQGERGVVGAVHPEEFAKRTSRRAYLYVHQYLGIFCLGWGLLVGTTGALLAFNPIFTQHFQKHTLQPLAKKYHRQDTNQPDVTLNAVMHTAFKAKPHGIIWYIVFPGMERGIEGHYLVLMHGHGVLSQYFSDYLIISARSAELKEIVHLPLLMQLTFIATPLHTANYGGIVLKIIWAMFAFTTFSFALLGILISYLKKRRIYCASIRTPINQAC